MYLYDASSMNEPFPLQTEKGDGETALWGKLPAHSLPTLSTWRHSKGLGPNQKESFFCLSYTRVSLQETWAAVPPLEREMAPRWLLGNCCVPESRAVSGTHATPSKLEYFR